MKIEALISFLQKMQIEYPGMDIRCAIPISENLIGPDLSMTLAVHRDGNKFGVLIALSKDQRERANDFEEKREMRHKVGDVMDLNFHDIIKPNDRT